MKILKTQVLRGPNIWSNYRKNLIQVRIDLEEMENFPTDKIPGFAQRLLTALPSLVEHECSEGRRGGFCERVTRGTWLGHVMEHVALEIQSLAGMETGYGRTRGTGVKGIYNMVFAYEVEQAGLYAAEAAFRIVDALSKNEPYDLEEDIRELQALSLRHGLGPSTKSIVMEASRRGIPWKRLGANSKIQLGYGKNQRQFQATMTCNTSATAVSTAGDKQRTKTLLREAGIPVADGGVCTTLEGMRELIDTMKFPIVMKPLYGNHGKGASVNIATVDDAIKAFDFAKDFGDYVMVEQFIQGADYRLLVVNGRYVAAARRIPATVVGDGVSSVRELIEQVNKDPRRGSGHEAVLTKIAFDKDTFDQLEKNGMNYESIPFEGVPVVLKSTANLSTGGTAEDVTDDVHPYNKFMAERIAGIIGLDICGIDVMTPSIANPLPDVGGVVLEVNAAPGFRMHLSPSIGKPRNVAKAVIDMLCPEETQCRIPIFAVTGTNGKTTTTRLLAQMAQASGHITGYTTTDGIYINGHKIVSGDTTGPQSAGMVLKDPTVEFAVLETARGGLIRGGLAFDLCDVGIITNIQEDHLGLNDINTLDDLANVKGVVARSVMPTGSAVLNAEDAHCVKVAATLDCNVVYFAMDPSCEVVAEHLRAGKLAIVLENNCVVIKDGLTSKVVAHVDEIPLALGGTAKFMIANVLASVAAARAYGFDMATIQKVLRDFTPDFSTTPGRMNHFAFQSFDVLVDYAHNPHGLLAMKDFLRHCAAPRKIGIVAGIGDRRDQDIVELASIAASMFDHIIVRQEHGLRGRTAHEINRLMVQGMMAQNPNITYDLIPDELDSINHALKMAQPGDYIVALSDQYEIVIGAIQRAQLSETQVLTLQTQKPLAC